MIKNEKPDIVIIDYKLEGKSKGVELLKSIDEDFPGIYVIIVSMNNEKFFYEKALSAGADEFIPKHELSDKLIKSIKSISMSK